MNTCREKAKKLSFIMILEGIRLERTHALHIVGTYLAALCESLRWCFASSVPWWWWQVLKGFFPDISTVCNSQEGTTGGFQKREHYNQGRSNWLQQLNHLLNYETVQLDLSHIALAVPGSSYCIHLLREGAQYPSHSEEQFQNPGTKIDTA